MNVSRAMFIYICQNLCPWSLDQGRTAMPACLEHAIDRQGRHFDANLPKHATEGHI